MKNIVHFETLGCRLNQDETEGAARAFSNAGFECDLVSISSKANVSFDVILSVINTCTVTSKAEQKARRIIRLLLEKFPNAPLIVTGCYAELDNKEILSINNERIVIIPGTRKFLLQKIAQEMASGILDFASNKWSIENLKSFVQQNISIFSVVNDNKKIPLAVQPFSLYTSVFEKHSRASLKIQDGCNNSCAFCRIHFARGRAISLSPEIVLERVLELESQNFSEVVLTGVNLSQYSSVDKAEQKYSFATLLDFLIKRTTKIKFRISSLYPEHITEDLCKVLKHGRVQPFFHLSIQSGSDAILSSMCRPYKRAQVENAVRLLRQYKENPFISCDIIAGFPGETEEDFSETKTLCTSLRFAWIHAFPFSPRPGTKAYTMTPKIPEYIKNERVKWLTQTAIKGKIDYINFILGKSFSAVVEKKSIALSSTKKIFHAVTDNFIHVEFESEKDLAQSCIVHVKIIKPLEENIKAGKEVECLAELL